MRRAICLPGKLPRAGRTKTRLSPPLTLEQAALVYRGFLQDSVALVLGLGWDRVTLAHPEHPEAARELSALLPPGVELLARPGGGLGGVLAGAFEHLLGQGFDRVVMIGSDNPTLPPERIGAASHGLADHDVVIGPSLDGGYFLLAMTRFHPALFEGIAWSTEVVYRQTIERAATLRLSCLSLEPWYDVDTVAELRQLQAELASLPPTVAPATRAVLSTLSNVIGGQAIEGRSPS